MNSPRHILVLAACTTVLLACTDHIETAKRSLESELPNSGKVEYRDINRFPGKTVCGEYLAFDKWGRGDQFKPFVVRGEDVLMRPSDTDRSIFCSEDPEAALQQVLGIGPVRNAGDDTLRQIRADIDSLSAALREYQADYGSLPRTDPGLQALISPADYNPASNQKPPEAYLEKLPMDPWGRPYRYWRKRMISVAHIHDIRTLGADGEEGGSGADADIGLKELEYIEHVLNL